ncbi:alpha/beta hydrolase [Nonomuraea sp. K274]|uniref:Alpha/beta hydrolase n=1 Tax=Nonomuraea cypriaca TaxID=1187855 RepID=A0A931F5K0_9ACTN|nr:alpha/beta hydrolase [Nonomuraea cypriaca]
MFRSDRSVVVNRNISGGTRDSSAIARPPRAHDYRQPQTVAGAPATRAAVCEQIKRVRRQHWNGGCDGGIRGDPRDAREQRDRVRDRVRRRHHGQVAATGAARQRGRSRHPGGRRRAGARRRAARGAVPRFRGPVAGGVGRPRPPRVRRLAAGVRRGRRRERGDRPHLPARRARFRRARGRGTRPARPFPRQPRRRGGQAPEHRHERLNTDPSQDGAELAKAQAAQLSKGVLLTNDADGHTAYHGDGTCLERQIDRY